MAHPDKATELAGAGRYPSREFGQRERKLLQTAESFAPADAGDWDTPPTAQDGALDELASRMSTAEGNIPAAASSAVGAGKTPQLAVAEWSFATHGGTVGNKLLGVSLPDNSMVISCAIEILTAPDSATDTGTVRLSVPTDGFLSANIAADGTATSSGSDGNNPKKLTAVRQLQAEIGGETVTTGVVRFYVMYYPST